MSEIETTRKSKIEILNDLPIDHPLRNTPMKEIHAEIRNKTLKPWRSLARWRIGPATFNQCAAWHEFNEFRVP